MHTFLEVEGNNQCKLSFKKKKRDISLLLLHLFFLGVSSLLQQKKYSRGTKAEIGYKS